MDNQTGQNVMLEKPEADGTGASVKVRNQSAFREPDSTIASSICRTIIFLTGKGIFFEGLCNNLQL
jgi:hypothetical protein